MERSVLAALLGVLAAVVYWLGNTPDAFPSPLSRFLESPIAAVYFWACFGVGAWVAAVWFAMQRATILT